LQSWVLKTEKKKGNKKRVGGTRGRAGEKSLQWGEKQELPIRENGVTTKKNSVISPSPGRGGETPSGTGPAKKNGKKKGNWEGDPFHGKASKKSE